MTIAISLETQMVLTLRMIAKPHRRQRCTPNAPEPTDHHDNERGRNGYHQLMDGRQKRGQQDSASPASAALIPKVIA